MTSADAAQIKWVDFGVPFESLQYAMNTDISTSEMETHISWIRILALAGSRTGGKCPIDSVRKAATDLLAGWSSEHMPLEQRRIYDYYYCAFDAVLGGFLGHYAVDGKATYGLKAYSPIDVTPSPIVALVNDVQP